MIPSNFTFKKSLFQNLIFFLLALSLIIYTSSRATLLSLTCDEASTYFSHIPNSIWSCFFSESCWSDANNHLLNTFLMQVSTNVFGVSEWTLRLPNLLGHLIYLIFSIRLILRYSNTFLLGIAGFCLLNLNPFLLEFFSLARGYGLGVGWMMMSIYYLFRWVESRKLSLGMYCYIGAFLAVLSNFIFLNYWASATAVFIFFILEKWFLKKNEKLKSNFLQSIGLPVLSSVSLFFLIKKPIQFLQSKGEFVYGGESLIESFVGMVKESVMSQGYFNPFTTNVFILLSTVLLGFSIVFGVFYFLKKRDNNFSKIYFAGIILMILMMSAMVVQYYLLDVKYLMGRKSTMLLPFFGLSVYLFLEFLYREKNKNWTIGFALLIIVFSFNHFYRTFDLKETVEWSYDAYTKDMIQYLDEHVEQKRKINLGVFWIYGPASEFYQKHFSMEKIEKVERLDEADFEEIDALDFIYVRADQVNLLKDKYVLEKKFGTAGVLFKKKN
ncbi:MAG: ArnT family glycosyltransferase [Saprospiraceae bacterium]